MTICSSERGTVGVDRADRPRLDAQPLERHRRRRRSVERPDPGQRLVQHDAERIQVRARADRVAHHLLRARVLGRPDHPAGRRAGIGRGPSDPEVGDPHLAVASIRMFAGLMSRWMMPCSWAKASARAVSIPTRTANPTASGPRPLEDLLEIRAIDQLHDDVIAARLRVDARVVDGHDVRVVERGRVARLAPESIHELRVFGKARAQDLDRDIAVEEFVMRKVHDRHPALADHLEQPVAASENALGQYHAPLDRGRASPRMRSPRRWRVTVRLQSRR